MKTRLLTKVWTVLIATAAIPQQAPFTPAPRILQIHQEQIVQGREPDYIRIETDAAATEGRLNFPIPSLAFQGVNRSGDIWFLNGYDSYSNLEQLSAQAAGDPDLSNAINGMRAEKANLVQDRHTIFARYREELSFGRGLSGQRTRYFLVSVVSVRPGHVRDYGDIRRILRAAHERAGSAEIHSVYQVESGMPDGTFLIFTPVAHMEDAGDSQRFDQTTFEDRLDSQTRTHLQQLNDAAVLQSETQIYRINPAISVPAKEWKDADVGFWNTTGPN